MSTRNSLLIVTLLLTALSTAGAANEHTVAAPAAADQASQIEADLRRHISVLASDEFGGRAPASPGEKLTTDYIAGQFKALGLAPGNGASYLQQVAVTEVTTGADTRLSLRGSHYSADLSYGDQMMVFTERQLASTELLDSEMVFVGYGIVAPERGWNDYAGVDVRGKTVVILVNDPGYATQDDTLFNGNAMTWYGRWPYKYEEAARQGAAGALIIHETGAAAYGWDVVYSSWSRPQIGLTAANRNVDKCAVDGWLSQASARALFASAGLDYEAQLAAATRPGFRAVPLGDVKASITLENTVRNSYSNNVIGYIPGSERPDETIIYSAHWDHLGTNPKIEGDNIFNGAQDNASGVAGLLSLARLFSALPEAPGRSVAFLAVTAEESGLLGSQWYSEHPLFPLETTVANINMDVLPTFGPVRDVVVVGYGNSELEDYLKQAVARQAGRYVAPEPHPERGFYYRSDHFNFARVGVPALYIEVGEDSFEHGREWGAARQREYIAERYHSPRDEYDPDWDLGGAALNLLLYFDVGRQLSMIDRFPNWYPGNEFRQIRDASAASRQH